MRDKLIESLKTMAHDLSNIEPGQDLHVLLEKTKGIYEKLVILDYLTKNIDLLEGEEELQPSSEDHEIVVAPELEKEATVEEFSESNETKEEKETLTSSDQIEIEEEHKSEEFARTRLDEIEIEEEEALDDLFEPKFDSIKEDFSQKDEFKDTISLDETEKLFETKPTESKSVSLNDRLLGKKIQVGLNDRIAFVNGLFNFSQVEFNRILDHLNTFETEMEAKHYIENDVKKKFNWTGKENMEERFLLLIEKRFL